MLESEVDMNDHDEETLASLQQANDQLMAKNHALVKALSRATQEMTCLLYTSDAADEL